MCLVYTGFAVIFLVIVFFFNKHRYMNNTKVYLHFLFRKMSQFFYFNVILQYLSFFL